MSQADFDASRSFAHSAAANDGNYNAFFDNCVDFASDTLTAANVYIPKTDLTVPDTFLDNFVEVVQFVKDTYWSMRDFLLGEDNYERWEDLHAVWEELLNGYMISEDYDEVMPALDDYTTNSIYSPIAIDLNGDGISTIALSDSNVHFDIRGEGITNNIGWINPEDAFLCLDVNQDGIINDVNELFGGQYRGDGFAKLATLDSNQDGLITSSDALFEELLLWTDKNSDGVTDDGELMSLATAKVSNLSLNYNRNGWSDKGNYFGEISSAEVDGVQNIMADIYFKFDSIIA